MAKDESEQWLLDGDCRKCRKAKYCSKQCRISKMNFEQKIHNYILEHTGLNKISNIIAEANRRFE